MASYADGLKITDNNSANGSLLHNTGNSRHSGASDNGRTSLVSSYQGRHYGTVNKGQWKANGFVIHTLEDSDTLQGIALKYSVPVSEIQRYNKLFSTDSIHLHTELKIPYMPSKNSSPSSSPRAMKRGLSSSIEYTDGRNLSGSVSSSEDEVKLKPSHAKMNESGEKSIKCLLDSTDLQLQKAKDFAEKLAIKNSAINREGYNREPVEVSPVTMTTTTTTTNETDSIRDKVRRVFERKTVWSPGSTTREEVADEIFQL